MGYYCMLDPKCPGNHASKYEMCWGTKGEAMTRTDWLRLGKASVAQRPEGEVYVLESEVTALRQQFDKISQMYRDQFKLRKEIQEDKHRLRLRLDEARKWMRHDTNCIQRWISNGKPQCPCGLNAFLESFKKEV